MTSLIYVPAAGRDMLSKQQNVFEILIQKIANEPIQASCMACDIYNVWMVV